MDTRLHVSNALAVTAIVAGVLTLGLLFVAPGGLTGTGHMILAGAGFWITLGSGAAAWVVRPRLAQRP